MEAHLEKLRLLRIELSHYEWAQDDRALELVLEVRNRYHFTAGNRVGHSLRHGLSTQRCLGCDRQLTEATRFATHGSSGCVCEACDGVLHHLVTQLQDCAMVLGVDWFEMRDEAQKLFREFYVRYARRNLNHNQNGWHLFG